MEQRLRLGRRGLLGLLRCLQVRGYLVAAWCRKAAAWRLGCGPAYAPAPAPAISPTPPLCAPCLPASPLGRPAALNVSSATGKPRAWNLLVLVPLVRPVHCPLRRCAACTYTPWMQPARLTTHHHSWYCPAVCHRVQGGGPRRGLQSPQQGARRGPAVLAPHHSPHVLPRGGAWQCGGGGGVCLFWG